MSNSPRYGQYDISVQGIDNLGARVLVLPDVPTDPADVFLARAYARAQKPSTVLNMYSRWINTAGQQLCKGKLDPIDGPVDVHIIASTGHCPAAFCALLSRLAEVVITDVQNIKHMSFTVEPDDAAEPRVFIVVSATENASDINKLTRSDILAMFPD